MKRVLALLAVLGLSAAPAAAAIYLVEADESGDFPTIAAAVEAAVAGDVIELGAGTFVGEGNRNVSFGGKALVIRSRGGAAGCILDCGGSEGSPARAFAVNGITGPGAAIEGITIRHGYLTGASSHGGAVLVDGTGTSVRIARCVFAENETLGWGGAVACTNQASVLLEDCEFFANRAVRGGAVVIYNRAEASLVDSRFRENQALRGGALFVSTTASAQLDAVWFGENRATGTSAPELHGGAIHATNSTLDLERCTFWGNQAEGANGGGVFTQLTTFTIAGSTFWGNVAETGGALACGLGGSGELANTLIAGSTGGGAISASTVPLAITCTDIFGNAGGDWTGSIAPLLGQDGNVTLDPLLCDPEAGDLTLQAGSPCAPFSPQNPGCDRVGVHEVRCGLQPVVVRSWGGIKKAYR